MMHNLLYDKLKTIPEDHPLLIVESYNTAQNSQEKMVEVLFEHFNFPKVVFVKAPACSLFSQGCTNGIIMEIGAGTSVCSPIYDGLCIKEATYLSLLSGQYLTNFFQNEVSQRHRREINNPFFFDKLKRKHFKCTSNSKLFEAIQSTTDNDSKIKVCLPDGKEIDISEECLKTPQLLFDPIEIDPMYRPIQSLLHETLFKLCEPDKKNILDKVKDFVYVTGGTVNMDGFCDMYRDKVRTSPKDVITDKNYTVALQNKMELYQNSYKNIDIREMFKEEEKVKKFTLNPNQSNNKNAGV